MEKDDEELKSVGASAAPSCSTDWLVDHTQQLGEIAGLVMDDAPKEICLTVDAVRWIRDRYRDSQKALRELEKIRTEKLAVGGFPAEASNVSSARVILSNVDVEARRK